MKIEERIVNEIIALLRNTSVTDFRLSNWSINILEIKPESVTLQNGYECQESIEFRGQVHVKHEVENGNMSQLFSINGTAFIENEHVTSLSTPLILQKI